MKSNLPVLYLYDEVIFPYSEIKIEKEDIESKKTLSLADNYYDGHILLITKSDTIPTLGIIGQIKYRIELPNGNVKASIKGINRVKIEKLVEENNILEATITTFPQVPQSPVSELASARKLKELFLEYIDSKPGIENSIVEEIKEINKVSRLTDKIVSFIPMDIKRKIKYVNEIDPLKRVELLIDDLKYELSLLNFEKELDDKIDFNINDSQREFLLREKLKAIKQELGEDCSDELKEKIDSFQGPSHIKNRLVEEYKRYSLCSSNSPELGLIRNYIDTLLELPWNKKTLDNTDYVKIETQLNISHYGLNKVKNRILEYIVTGEYKKNNSPILCLVGRPGTGKTSIAKTIAKVLNRKTIKISVGGINDEAEITGHRRTYVGAAPGKIIKNIKNCGVNNPVFIIDEIDKMTKDSRGDPASSLLDVLDKEQNNKFVDHFIEEEFDLSNVLFILTANYIDKIPNELRDRLEIIEINSYTKEDKMIIAKDYLLRKIFINYDLDLKLEDSTLENIIDYYTKESGVRELDRVLNQIARRYSYDKIMNNELVDFNNLDYYLGNRKYDLLENYENSIGMINALGYSEYGGELLKIETANYKGKGNLIKTGNIGPLMEESINIAFDYIKAHYSLFNIRYELLEQFDYHVNIPSSIEKDGLSAGISIVTSMLALILKYRISNKIALTGEITLSGKILKVGGLKEKIILAIKNGIEELYIPKQNENDLKELKSLIDDKITIKLVDNYREVYKDIFSKYEK